MKRTRLEKLISVLLVGALVIVGGNAWLAFRAEQVMAQSESWVAHSWQVIGRLDYAIGLVKDVESCARGYIITGEPRYLAASRASRLALPAQLADLRSLVADNAQQVERVQLLTRLVLARMATIDKSVDARRTRGRQAGFAAVGSGSGIEEMGALRALITRMQAHEQVLLADRLRASARARTEARLTVAFASTLDMIFIIATIWSLGYERRLRLLASGTARRLEKLQAISDVGLTRLSLAELTREMLDRLRRVAEIDAVALFKWNVPDRGQDNGQYLEMTAADGVDLAPGAHHPAPPGSPLAESIIGNALVKLNGGEVSRLGIPAFEAPGAPMSSVLILPLSMAARVSAVIVAGRLGENAFTRQDEEVLSVVADRIALAIDRASLFEAEHEARRLAESFAGEVQLLNAELEERVRQRTAELEATNQELEAFSYSVSHDLRAPLRSVDGFSVALAEDYADVLTEEGKHYLERIRAGVQRMGQLIDALLQLSRITRAELVVEPVDLSAIALEVAAELEREHPGRRIAFRIEPGLRAEGDPRLLGAIFENMLGNAVKFTARVAEARIEFGYSEDRGAYYIRDNGAGFDQQYAKKLFVAFQRLHGDKDFKGSGIGLATVGRVIRRHHGTMSAEGVIGEGATFWFTLGANPS